MTLHGLYEETQKSPNISGKLNFYYYDQYQCNLSSANFLFRSVNRVYLSSITIDQQHVTIYARSTNQLIPSFTYDHRNKNILIACNQLRVHCK